MSTKCFRSFLMSSIDKTFFSFIKKNKKWVINMGVFVTFVSLGCFILFMSLYKIFQTSFLRYDKTTIEEIGFLPDSLLNFLEFAVLVVTFLAVENWLLSLEETLLMKIGFIFACFCLFVIDDVILYKKLKK